MGWKLPGILRFLPAVSIVPRPQIQRTLGSLPLSARILDVGAGGRRIAAHVLTFDAEPRPEVDIVGDIHHMPIPDDSLDCVICTGTLEHVRDPWKAIQEIYRVLKPGGIALIGAPFIQGYHADPADYWRFTLDGLKLLCRDFEEIDSGVSVGPSCALTWVAREWASSCSKNRYLSNLLLALIAYLLTPLKYLDYLLVGNPMSARVASALYYRGRKPGPGPQTVGDSAAHASATRVPAGQA